MKAELGTGLSAVQAGSLARNSSSCPSGSFTKATRKLATLNPYSLEPDRTRWTSGFTEALTEERPVTKLRKRP